MYAAVAGAGGAAVHTHHRHQDHTHHYEKQENEALVPALNPKSLKDGFDTTYPEDFMRKHKINIAQWEKFITELNEHCHQSWSDRLNFASKFFYGHRGSPGSGRAWQKLEADHLAHWNHGLFNKRGFHVFYLDDKEIRHSHDGKDVQHIRKLLCRPLVRRPKLEVSAEDKQKETAALDFSEYTLEMGGVRCEQEIERSHLGYKPEVDVVMYEIEVVHPGVGMWAVWKRYADFVTLRKDIKNTRLLPRRERPKFHKHTHGDFTGDRFDVKGEYIKQRRQNIADYLNDVIAIPKLKTNNVLLDFLELEQHTSALLGKMTALRLSNAGLGPHVDNDDDDINAVETDIDGDGDDDDVGSSGGGDDDGDYNDDDGDDDDDDDDDGDDDDAV